MTDHAVIGSLPPPDQDAPNQDPPLHDRSAWHRLVANARRHGDFLQAIDLARQALEHHPHDLRLAYEKALAYARAGAITEAETDLRHLRSTGALEAIPDPDLRLDFGALQARLLKDRALTAHGAEAPPLLLAAAAAYEAVHTATNAYFPAINAATLYHLADNPERGAALAKAALHGAAAAPAGYWPAATTAEAHLLLGNHPAAIEALHTAIAARPHLDELASTRRQLALLSRNDPNRAQTLAALPAPHIVTWTTGDCPSLGETGQAAIAKLAAAHAGNGLPILAFGAVNGPADIEAAEAFQAAGAHTHLVIACDAPATIAAAAHRLGPDWSARLSAALAAARGITEVTLEGDSTEPTVAAMAIQQARGLAAMRAAALATQAHTLPLGPPAAAPRTPSTQARTPRVFVFGDVKGFSTIPEAAHRPFLDHVIGGFAQVLETLGGQVEYTETAGDGILVVLSGVAAALRCCDGLQRSMAPARIAASGLPPTLGLRLAAHVGPVATGLDRVTGRHKFIGKEVIRTARIEPITPVGQTYVTEQFAATLHALTPSGTACEYVGWQPMAKGFGRCRMYSLRPTAEMLALLDP